MVCFFESKKENFPQRFLDFRSPWIYLVADLERRFFKHFKVENSWLKFFHPQSAYVRIQAGLNGYIERNIDGKLSTVPAHFLMWDGLRVAYSYYGKSLGDHLNWDITRNFANLSEDKFKDIYPPMISS